MDTLDSILAEEEIQSEEKINLLSFKINQDKFHQALSLVSRVVSKHPIQAVLSNILLKSNKESGLVTIAATDLDVGLSVNIEAEISDDGQATIPAQKLQELVSKLPKQELSITCTENLNFNISCGRSNFNLKGMSAKDFPLEYALGIKDNSNSTKITLPIEFIKQGCSMVSFASEKKEVNNILNGICLEMGERGLELAATDGSRLAYYHVPFCCNSETNRKVIIPFRTVNELLRVIADTDEETIECCLDSDASIIFKTLNRTLVSNIIDGNYPRYQQLIPVQHSYRAIVNKEIFTSSLERVAVLANEKSRVVKLLFEEIGVLNISSNTPELGEAKEVLDLVSFGGQDFTIAFNVNFTLEALKIINTAQVELTMIDGMKPLILRPLKEETEDFHAPGFEYLYLIMPIQTRG